MECQNAKAICKGTRWCRISSINRSTCASASNCLCTNLPLLFIPGAVLLVLGSLLPRQKPRIYPCHYHRYKHRCSYWRRFAPLLPSATAATVLTSAAIARTRVANTHTGAACALSASGSILPLEWLIRVPAPLLHVLPTLLFVQRLPLIWLLTRNLLWLKFSLVTNHCVCPTAALVGANYPGPPSTLVVFDGPMRVFDLLTRAPPCASHKRTCHASTLNSMLGLPCGGS